MVRGLNLISCCSQQRIRSLIPTRMFCADVRRVVLRAVLRAAARACWRRVLARCVPRAPYCVLRLALLCERAGARAPRSQRSAHRLVVRCSRCSGAPLRGTVFSDSSLWQKPQGSCQFKVGSLRVRDGCVLRPQRATVLAPSGVPTRRALQRAIDSISG